MESNDQSRYRLIAAIRAGHQVRRFHTHPIVRDETVGHHSAGVMSLLTGMYFPNFPRAEVFAYALMHDVGEQWVGDVPAQAKWASPALKGALNDAENQAWEDNDLMLPDSLTEKEHIEVKFADGMDCLLKCLDELELGNRSMLLIVGRLVPYLLALAPTVPKPHRGFAVDLITKTKELIDATYGS